MIASPADSSILPDFDKLWNFGNPVDTEREFRKILPIAEGNNAYHAELLTQLARTLNLQRKFDKAHEVLDSAEKIIPADNSKVKIRYSLERGRIFNASGNKERAKDFFLNAWKIAIDANEDYYAVDAAHMMAIAEISHDEQHKWNLKALEIAEKSTEPRARKWLGALYNNIGWTYHDSGDFHNALEIFKKALEWRTAEKHVAEIQIAKWSVARAYRSLGSIEKALSLQKELLSELPEMPFSSDGYIFEEIGECLLLQNDDKAKEYFLKAYELLSTDVSFKQNHSARLERMKDLGGNKD